ncbi:hypothetical protein, partial [Alicyclobacillus hesperidum]|uniref:hypothetical protein n=1 Tax=Alicyclobacillus hesperidum TaxID=89784 RepID=UPI0024E04AF1
MARKKFFMLLDPLETVAAYLTKMQQARHEGRPIDDVVTRRSRRSMMEPFLNHIRERLSDYPEL